MIMTIHLDYPHYVNNYYHYVGFFIGKERKKIAKCLCNSQKSYTFAVKKTKNK